MNAEQYRALVNKLESIQKLDELKIGDINPATGQRITGGIQSGDGTLWGSGTSGQLWNGTEEPVSAPPAAEAPAAEAPAAEPPAVDGEKKQPCDPDTLAKIKYMPSFNKAFAAARAAGCEKFDWCGVYTTQEQGVMPQPGIPAAVGNPTVYAQGINMAVNKAKAKGIIGQSGPYTPQDVAKVVQSLQNGTIGYQLDPKSHSTSEVETFTRMLSDQLLKGDKRASADFKTPLDQRTFPAPKR